MNETENDLPPAEFDDSLFSAAVDGGPAFMSQLFSWEPEPEAPVDDPVSE